MRTTITLIFLTASLAQCQSQAPPTVADAARAARESKQAAEAEKARRKVVYTNENLPAAAIKDTSEPAGKESPLIAAGKKTTALQWKAAIASQRNLVAAHQDRIEKAEKNIQFVTANGYANGPRYNAEQKKRQDQLEAEKKKLDKEKAKLEEMKEAARKAGFGSSVYDQ